MILYKNYLMVCIQFFIVAADDLLPHLIEIVNVVILFEQTYHIEENIGQHLCVVDRTVVVELAEPEMLGESIQLHVEKLGQDITRDRDGIDRSIVVFDAEVRARLADETAVERRVVRHEYSVAAEIEEAPDSLLLRRSALYHAVGYAGELDYLSRDRTLGIGKGREAVDDHAVLYLHGADLGDLVVGGVQSGCLEVETHKGAVEPHICLTLYRSAEVVDKIRLGAVDDLDLFTVALEALSGVHSVGERLRHAVIGDSYGGVTEISCALYQLASLGDSVHLAHVGVQMELHSLLGRFVDYFDLLDKRYRLCRDDRIAGKFIEFHIAGNDDGRAFFYALEHRAVLHAVENLNGDGAGVVGYIEVDDVLVAGFGDLGLTREDVAPYGRLAGIVGDLLYRHQLALGHPAVDRLDGGGDDLRIEILALAYLDFGYDAVLLRLGVGALLSLEELGQLVELLAVDLLLRVVDAVGELLIISVQLCHAGIGDLEPQPELTVYQVAQKHIEFLSLQQSGAAVSERDIQPVIALALKNSVVERTVEAWIILPERLDKLVKVGCIEGFARILGIDYHPVDADLSFRYTLLSLEDRAPREKIFGVYFYIQYSSFFVYTDIFHRCLGKRAVELDRIR